MLNINSEIIQRAPRRAVRYGVIAIAAVALFGVALFGVYRRPAGEPGIGSIKEYLREAGGITVDAAGDLYLSIIVDQTQNNAGQVVKAGADGELRTVAGNGAYGVPVFGAAAQSPLVRPEHIAVDDAGNLYIATIIASVLKVSAEGNLSLAAGNDRLGIPIPGPATSSPMIGQLNLAADGAGNLYIADFGNYLVLKVDPAGNLSIIAGNGLEGEPRPGPATASPLSDPRGMAVDSAGNLYLGQSYIESAKISKSWVVKITPQGMLSIVAGSGKDGDLVPGPASASPLNLLYPSIQQALAVDAADNLYIGSWYQVAKVTPDGALSIFAGNGQPASKTNVLLPGPGMATFSPLLVWRGIAMDGGDNLYVFGIDTVVKITPEGWLTVVTD
jgi:DNA-binding beta-propeller fold protein YncE